MHLIWILIVGFCVGLCAKFFMPGRDGGGWIITTLLGILGSFVGTYLGQWMGFYTQGQVAGFIASVLGAMVVLFLARLLTKK